MKGNLPKIDDEIYKVIPVLKLTTGKGFNYNNLNDKQKEIYHLLQKESETNNFTIEYI